MRSWKSRMVHLAETYGPAGLAIWWLIFLVTLLGFAAMISFGWRAQEAPAGEAQLSLLSTFGLAYVATALTKPARVLATLALTPVMVKRLPWLFVWMMPANERSVAQPPSCPPNA